MQQIFSANTMLEKFRNATITGHFGFVFEDNSVSERMIIVPTRFLKCFWPYTCADTQSLQFEERFRNRLGKTASLTGEKKLRFQIPPSQC